MSLQFFPANKSRQQEIEHANKEMAKVLSPQPHSDNAIEHMSDEDYVRFVEEAESERQSLIKVERIKVERKKRRRANIILYLSMVLGAMSTFVGHIYYDAADMFGWIAIFLGVAGIAFLAKYATLPYGSSFGWRGIVSLCLSVWGIGMGLGAIGSVVY